MATYNRYFKLGAYCYGCRDFLPERCRLAARMNWGLDYFGRIPKGARVEFTTTYVCDRGHFTRWVTTERKVDHQYWASTIMDGQ